MVPVLLLLFVACKKSQNDYSSACGGPKSCEVKIDSISYDTTLYGNGTELFAFSLPNATNFDSVILMSKVSAHFNSVIQRVDELEYDGLVGMNNSFGLDFSNTTVLRYPINKDQINLFNGNSVTSFVYVSQSNVNIPDTITVSITYFFNKQ
jgi:hypothetical protein